MQGTVLIIFGSNTRIGYAVVDLFIQKQYNVFVVAENYVDFKYKDNDVIHQITFDNKSFDNVQEIVDRVGKIDILINNPGIPKRFPYNQYPEEAIDKGINANLKAPIAFINAVSKQFLERGNGRIVNITSQAAETGHSDIWYGIEKAGLINLTRSYAAELGGKGVIINAVITGPVDVDMLSTDSHVHKRHEQLVSRTYLKRSVLSTEVARTVFWLAVESPEYINGDTIDLNNGMKRIVN